MSMFGILVTGWKKIITRIIFASGIIISLFIIVYACKKDPDNLGRDLLPSSGNINVKIDSLTKISSYSISGKGILSSSNELYILGSQKDSIFGLSSASILTQFHPSMLISADSTRTVDSLVLYLSSANHFGDTLSQLTLRVFMLNEKMSLDTNYYSDINPNDYVKDTTELAHTTFAVGDSLIRVKINDQYFLDKFETLPDSVFSDLTDFAEQFYGFYLTVDQVSEKGGYAYLNMSSLNTRLTLYYNGDTLSYGYEMAFTTLAAKANKFTHEYPGFPIADHHLDSPDSKDSLIFIDGLGGASGRISFPELETSIFKRDSLANRVSIAINKAELILPVDTLFYTSLSEDNYPPNLWLITPDNENLYDFLIDKTGTYIDGSYDKTQHAYVFNIGLHLQSYIHGDIKNSDLVLFSRQRNSTANHVILKGATALNSPIKLKIIYNTELF